MLQSVFKAVLVMSAVSGALAALLLLLKPLTQRLFGSRWQYFAWYAVLVAALLPVSVTLPQAQSLSVPKGDVSALNVENIRVGAASPVGGQSAASQAATGSSPLMTALAVIWIIGAVWCVVSAVVEYYLFLRTIRKNSEFVQKYNAIKVLSTGLLSAPLTVGLFKKTILIPSSVENGEEKHHILCHEYTHIRHRDILYKWICMAAKCVHWFNPLMYMVSSAIDEACELVCDESVTRHMSEEEKKGYMSTVLSMISRSCASAPLTTRMADSKHSIKRRFAAITCMRKRSKLISGVSVICGVFVFASAMLVSGLAGSAAYDGGVPYLSFDFSRETETIGVKPINTEVLQRKEDKALSAEPVYGSDAIEAKDELPFTEEAAHDVSQVQASSPHQEAVTSSLPAEVERKVLDEMREYEIDENQSVYHPYSGQVKFDGLTMEALTAEIEQAGTKKAADGGVNLADSYIANTLSYKNGSKDEIKNVTCDENGKITFYMSSDYERHVNISFLEDGKVIGGYGVVPDNETIYAFGGFDPGKTYDITVSSETGDTWKIESDYIIY